LKSYQCLGHGTVQEPDECESLKSGFEDQWCRVKSKVGTRTVRLTCNTEFNNVIKTLRGEAEAETDGREGLRSLELLIAAYLSARDGRTVPLPLEY
jgi:UDP-N-acetyl-2-amino-2-deoxyglucuronate dehydrogenase